MKILKVICSSVPIQKVWILYNLDYKRFAVYWKIICYIVNIDLKDTQLQYQYLAHKPWFVKFS